MLTASAQRSRGKFKSSRLLMADSIRVLLDRSLTPFCSGVYEAQVSCRIPLAERYWLKSPSTYSPPLSERRIERLTFEQHRFENGGRLDI